MFVANDILIIRLSLPRGFFLHPFLKEVFGLIFLDRCASLINELTSPNSGLKPILFLVLTKFQLSVVKLFNIISTLFGCFAEE